MTHLFRNLKKLEILLQKQILNKIAKKLNLNFKIVKYGNFKIKSENLISILPSLILLGRILSSTNYPYNFCVNSSDPNSSHINFWIDCKLLVWHWRHQKSVWSVSVAVYMNRNSKWKAIVNFLLIGWNSIKREILRKPPEIRLMNPKHKKTDRRKLMKN